MTNLNSNNEIDIANITQRKLLGIYLSGKAASSEDFTNVFLAKHLNDFLVDFDEDGAVQGLKRFADVAVFRNAARVLRKVQRMMSQAVDAFNVDNASDCRKVFAEIEAVVEKSGVLESLASYIKENPDERLWYTKSALKGRGWTEAMIRDFLKADIEVTPQCGFMGYRSYYLDTKVEAVEKTRDFRERVARKRKNAAVA